VVSVTDPYGRIVGFLDIKIKTYKTILYCTDVKPGLSPYRKKSMLLGGGGGGRYLDLKRGVEEREGELHNEEYCTTY
jgi:hypothetical protein